MTSQSFALGIIQCSFEFGKRPWQIISLAYMLNEPAQQAESYLLASSDTSNSVNFLGQYKQVFFKNYVPPF